MEPKTRSEAPVLTEAPSEATWPAQLAILLAVILYITLPEHLTLSPRWLVPVLELALLVPLAVFGPRRIVERPGIRRVAAIVLIAIINAANVASLVLLVHYLTTPGTKVTGLQLLYSAASVWFTNIIVFGLWYWELDGGGPHRRLEPSHRGRDFLFPQMITTSCAPKGWSPSFIDYLFVSFTNASAFSPTDTMPLTPAAKMLFMVQAVASLLTVALVAARAVNILS
jgi:uncharacterized membrane protein